MSCMKEAGSKLLHNLIDSLISATASNTAPLNNDPQGSSGIKITNEARFN